MLKNSLFQPSLSFCFSALIFLSSFLVSALSLFCSALFLPFLFQHFFSFVSPFQRHFFLSSVSASLFFLFSTTFFCFFRRVALFFQPKTFLLQPKTFFNSAHTTVSASFSFCWFCFQRLLFFFLFQRLVLFFLPTSKAKNILFRCFTFLLFE